MRTRQETLAALLHAAHRLVSLQLTRQPSPGPVAWWELRRRPQPQPEPSLKRRSSVAQW